MIIYFVRHLKTKGNFEKRYIGKTDEDIYKAESQTPPSNLPENPSKIYTSAMKRTVQTAKLLYPNREVIKLENLNETDFGDFENKNYEELKNNKDYRDFIDGIKDPVGGESRKNFNERCIKAFLNIAKNGKDEIVIVCHGGTIMSILQGLDREKKDFYSYQIKNGETLVCEYDGKYLTRKANY
ncbi:MAG: histidine phosphatase family protein [Clostridia bacterium]